MARLKDVAYLAAATMIVAFENRRLEYASCFNKWAGSNEFSHHMMRRIACGNKVSIVSATILARGMESPLMAEPRRW